MTGTGTNQLGDTMKTNGLLSLGTTLPTMLCHSVMHYKRHNQGLRARVRRKYLGGYWLPKWARGKKNSSLKREVESSIEKYVKK